MKNLAVLFAALALPFSVSATSIADSHTEMAGCEACHDDGLPSTDLVFENQSQKKFLESPS